MIFRIDGDAFSSGQIQSKLWLCAKLEEILGWRKTGGIVVWLFGGWYGVINLLLQTRANIRIDHVRSFDIDPQATLNAQMLNESWVLSNKFKAFTVDCSDVDYKNLDQYETRVPDLIINTSTEHFESMAWFTVIPDGIRVVLQSNDMLHDDHLFQIRSQSEMQTAFPLKKIEISDELRFDYPDWSFTRYMLIGIK